MKHPWIQLRNVSHARVLLILPCNAAACVGNYFRAEVYSRRGWNTWREADANLHDLREEGRVAFAAADSSTLETQPEDSRGAIVLETEMHRVRNPKGEDWGAPSWRRYRPTPSGRSRHLETLTEAFIKGVRRVESMDFPQVLTLINPRAYFLALAAAVDKCGLMDQWLLFRAPAHPRYLFPAIKEVFPFVRAAAEGCNLQGGIYPIPHLYPIMQREARLYRHHPQKPWKDYAGLPCRHEINMRWASLTTRIEGRHR